MPEENIKLPEELANKLKEKIKDTEFSSIEEYTLYVLQQVVSSQTSEKAQQVYTKEESELLKKRMEDLGYI
jgi:Arc/MetJ-type ribon-helix-helix transcriptional regulator